MEPRPPDPALRSILGDPKPTAATLAKAKAAAAATVEAEAKAARAKVAFEEKAAEKAAAEKAAAEAAGAPARARAKWHVNAHTQGLAMYMVKNEKKLDGLQERFGIERRFGAGTRI